MRSAVAIVALLCCTLFAWGQAEVHWLQTEHEFGTFNEENGSVSCTMRLVNTGDSILVITRVQSTCGCTATEYTRTGIEPGDTASVTLTYNPANRPGSFKKDVYVYTNGTPRRSRLTISGKVIGAEVTVDEKYPVRAGNLRLEVENVPMGEMYRGATRNAYINTYNASRDTLVVTVDGNLPHVSLNAAPDTVAPGEASAIVVHYDTRQAPLWGLNVDTLLVMSEPLHNSPTAISGIARVYVMAQVLEDMRKVTPEQRLKGPELKVSAEKVIYENMHRGTVATQAITLANKGKGVLNVRRLWCPDKAVTIGRVPERIKRGKEAKVEISVDPSRLEGDVLNTTLTVITDDPYTPQVTVRLVGMVAKGN